MARDRIGARRWGNALVRNGADCGARGAAPLRPVTVGIIGAGNVIWAYFQVLDRLVPSGLALIGPVCGRRKETWPDFESRRPGLRLVAEPAEVLQSDVDVVLVITPPESHAGLVRLALEYGKHVVVEKPAATTHCEAEQLCRIAEGRGLHLMCAPFVQLAPTFRALWRRIQGGVIGKVHSARGLYGNAGSNWAPWYHDGKVSPLAEVGIYNLRALPRSSDLSSRYRALRVWFCMNGRSKGRGFEQPGQTSRMFCFGIGMGRFPQWYRVIASSAIDVQRSNSTEPKAR